jgi:hypothetical protein
MKLGDVRSLKQELTAELRTTGHVTRSTRGAPAAVAQAWWRTVGYVLEHAPKEVVRTLGIERPHTPPIAFGVAAGKDGYALSVQVQDESLLGSAVLDRIARRAHGAVDVHYVGRPVPAAEWHRETCRPLRAGASIGSRPEKTTGTLGGFVRPVGGGDMRILSNAHVLAGYGGAAPQRAGVVQPGWDDGGTDDGSVVAELEEFVKLDAGPDGNVDCAMAKLVDGFDVDLPVITGVDDADVDEPVFKDGRTTGRTSGRVLAIDVGPVEFDYPELGTVVFDGILSVDGVGDGRFGWMGDSGSLVVRESDGRAIGLFFGVTGTGGRNHRGIAYVAPMRTVLDRLGVEFVTSSG